MIGLILIFAAFLILLTLGMSVPFSILVSGLIYLFAEGGFSGFKGLGLIHWANLDNFTFTAIPLFILMAEVLQTSRVTVAAYEGLAVLTSRLPGRLLQSNILGCAAFATVSGSSIVTAASIGSVALPELMKRKYNPRLSAGSLAAGGTLGILLPPSIVMIIYSTFTETSVAKLFAAGVIPGLLLVLMFMGYIAVHAAISPEIVGQEEVSTPRGRVIRALLGIAPLIFLMVIVMGGMYAGIVTPTEGAAVGVLLAVVLACYTGSFSWQLLHDSLVRTVLVTGNILLIVSAAYVFSHAMSVAGAGELLTNFIVARELTRLEFFIGLIILFTILGSLVESIGMIVITVPLLFPILHVYNIDPIWFGVALVIFVELGQISPPIGINLFVIQSIWKGKLSDVVMGTIPFHIIMILLLIMIMVWPDIVLWLPSTM